MPNTPIHTLQFPHIQHKNREGFLDFVNKHVLTFALQRQCMIAEKNGDAAYFHKDKALKKNRVPVLIHAMEKDNCFTLRAYTQNAINTLLIWLELFADIYPTLCCDIIHSSEQFEFRESKTRLHYKSNNWIPFRYASLQNGCYYKEEQPANFSATLTGNLRTFLQSMSLENKNIRTEVTLNQILNKHKEQIALKTKTKGIVSPIIKWTFELEISCNVVLPLYFSIGQNPAYGNGIFYRIKSENEMGF